VSGGSCDVLEADVGEPVDEEDAMENEREGVDLMLLVLLRAVEGR
jgi:hypothetical protein